MISPGDDPIVGTCSLCRGPVRQPRAVGSPYACRRYCAACGAKEALEYGPIIKMERQGNLNLSLRPKTEQARKARNYYGVDIAARALCDPWSRWP